MIKPRLLLLVHCALVALVPTMASAKVERVALVVANHKGGEGLLDLRYAARDAERLSQVLLDLGGFEKNNIVALLDEGPDKTWNALAKIEERVKKSKARGDDTLLLFYYSGHAEKGELKMNGKALSMARLNDRLARSSADVRIALIDSCGAGEMTGQKGATPAPAFVLSIENTLKTRGQAIIASSTASESSQESDSVQGSYFTHYLTSGMRGAADEDASGKVTLEEAYQYAYHRTVTATAGTRSGAQHPTYAFDLKGAGEVVLTEPRGGDVLLSFGEELDGHFLVIDEDRQRFVAEVDKSAGQASQLSLPLGRYVIKKRLPTHLLMQRLPAREKGTFVVETSAFERVDFSDDYAKGSPIARPDENATRFALAVGVGAQGVFDQSATFPSMPKFTLVSRWRLANPPLVMSADMTLGRLDKHRVATDILGGIEVNLAQAEFAFAALYEQRFGRFGAGLGPRAGLHLVFAEYTSTGTRQQQVSPMMGAEALVSYQLFWGARAEGIMRGTYFIYPNPNVRGIFFVDALFAFSWVF